jgi:acyl carrier protein phosphodiesterase
LNYLAHIHLAHLSDTSLLGNFLGDFVKGTNLSFLPPDIQEGIQLHRAIDSFTDSHPRIVELRRQFPSDLRRMSGVVIDIYFDHLLCAHWDTFTELGIAPLLSRFYAEVEETPLAIPGRYSSVKDGLLKYRWLQDYEHRDSCIRAFYQIEKRLNGRVTFAQLANRFLQDEHAGFETCFERFYPELIDFVMLRES